GRLDQCLIQSNKDEGCEENEENVEDETISLEGHLEEDCEAELNAVTKTLGPSLDAGGCWYRSIMSNLAALMSIVDMIVAPNSIVLSVRIYEEDTRMEQVARNKIWK
nr:hypothetical protein [Tanacetum cinerariifolium]